MTEITANGAVARPDLDKGLGGAGKIGLGRRRFVAAIGYVAYSMCVRRAGAAGVGITAFLPLRRCCSSPLLIALRLRVRERLPRHRQCGGHGDLHQFRCRPMSRWSGRASSTSSACCCRPGRSPSASSRCCRWS